MGNSAEGGAIYNSGTISNITGNFIGNYIQNDDSGSSNFMLGGAIRAAAASGNGSMTITGNFLYNYAVKMMSTTYTDMLWGEPYMSEKRTAL